MASIQATRSRYQAEGSTASLTYVRFLHVDSESFALTGAGAAFTCARKLLPESSAFFLASSDVSLPRGLRMPLASESFSLALFSAQLNKGFIFQGDTSSFSAGLTDAGLFRASRLAALTTSVLVARYAATLIRPSTQLVADLGAIAFQGFDIGFKHVPPTLSGAVPVPALEHPYGGSDDTSASFMRSRYVKFNSLQKAQDLGVVSNLLAVATGNVGSQSGTNTVFFAVETDGRAQLRITNSSTSPYTSRYISVGILDSAHKPLPLNAQGYAYADDIHGTSVDESAELLDPGVYYFTVSTNQWQSLPFEVTLQVFRYASLIGAASGSMAPYARLALAKLYSAATLAAPLRGTLAPNATLEAIQGAAVLQALPRLTLVIMKGAAGGTLSPYGRLKQTHRISGAASGANSNVATLTSITPYGGGY